MSHKVNFNETLEVQPCFAYATRVDMHLNFLAKVFSLIGKARRLSASNMFDGLICTLCEGLGLMRQIRLRARRLTPTA